MKRIMLLSVVGCAFLARVGTAQEVQPTNLKPADAVLTLPFRSAASVRELRDGRVIFEMAGRTGAYAAIADMKSGRMDSIPGFPLDAVFPLAADTSLIRASGGWVFAKGITVLGMLEATNPVVVAARNLTGVDSLGFVVALRNYGADSSDVLRVNRSTAEVEQLVRIQRFPGVRGGVPAPYYQNREHVIYTLDGWLGVLRIAPYRVDWRSPAGTWTLGKPIPVPVVRFDDREEKAYWVSQALEWGQSVPESRIRDQYSPDVVEHSTGQIAPIATPDGKMLVYRTPTADFPNTRYDVVNREGVVERQVTIGAKERIIGFGAKSVYVRVGLWFMTEVKLERHPWP